MAADFFTGDLFARVRQAVRPGRTPVVGRGAPTDRALYQAASLLLDYPTTELVEQVPTVRALVAELGGPARSLLPLLCLLYTSDAARRSTLCRSRWSPYH